MTTAATVPDVDLDAAWDLEVLCQMKYHGEPCPLAAEARARVECFVCGRRTGLVCMDCLELLIDGWCTCNPCRYGRDLVLTLDVLGWSPL